MNDAYIEKKERKNINFNIFFYFSEDILNFNDKIQSTQSLLATEI